MEEMWLLCDYKGKQFDVRVEDVDLTSILDLFNEIHDESVKQGVWLPENFRVYYKHPRTKKLVELYDDPHLSNMWGGFVGLDTVEKVGAVKKKGAKKGFKTAKTTAKRVGTYVPKTRRSERGVRKPRNPPQQPEHQLEHREPELAEESEDDDDDDEDDDYVGEEGSSEDEGYDLQVEDEVEGEELDVLLEKEFEDYLDGGSVFDKLYTNGTFVGEMLFGQVKLDQWMIFSNKDHFLGVFKDYCIQEGFAVRVEKADNLRFTARCIIEDCEWRIHASKLMDGISWATKSVIGEHKLCGRMEENPMVTSVSLTRRLGDVISANPDVPVHSLQKMCLERFRINVKERLLYKVKCMTKEQMYGGFSESYGLLPAYAEMIKRTNTGSYALVTWTTNSSNNTPKFKACFFSFATQFKGFLRRCRPIIAVDGTHLSGFYKGILLTVVGIDGNNEIFQIAYGIVDIESKDSWTYSFRNLKLVFQSQGVNKDDWTFISDRMRGVEGALLEIAANAYNLYVYNKAMEKITKVDPKATEYLDKAEEQWSRHVFDPVVCCDHKTTNFVESFNACIKPFRDLPVLTLLEEIRGWCMKKMGARFDRAVDMEPTDLTEYATKLLEVRADESRFFHVVEAGGGEFEVLDDHVHFPIRLETRTCGCGKWQGTGIPCKHGLRVIFDQRLNSHDYVSEYYKGAAYKETYASHIHPMPNSSQWPEFELPVIHPPPFKRCAGRPAKQRRRGPNEKKKGKRSSTIKCGKCKEVGHNSRTCKGGATQKQRKESGASTSQPQQSEGRKRKAAASPSTSKVEQKNKERKATV
ncbi:uncharacterized protein LOC104908037 [Beta vulgaris subsp. vulgaris]|uniref:uncharacterized protein LOC104908037 n=1 Tax=Beta vulgaris subsp. vulgaris TaxID=3555 RepID=UPI0025491617|nr:uncharacterized protein LOC104908037 [Beta vulgaris subsp. vulgaris]